MKNVVILHSKKNQANIYFRYSHLSNAIFENLDGPGVRIYTNVDWGTPGPVFEVTESYEEIQRLRKSAKPKTDEDED